MSRKQELYLLMLKIGFLYIRGSQSQNIHNSWWRLRFWKRRSIERACCEVAQLLHNVPSLIARPDFTQHDFWFLNGRVRRFYERDTAQKMNLGGIFQTQVRQLFKLVPEDQRDQLKWNGPELPERTPVQQAEVNKFLFYAVAENSNIETLHNALADGPKLNARNSEGKTAIQIAAELGKMDYVEALKEAEATMP